jgi:hypothetical protein
MSASASAITTITTSDILLLASGYCHNNLQQWGQVGLLEGFLEQGPYIAITDWSMSHLGAQLICLIDPNSPQP